MLKTEDEKGLAVLSTTVFLFIALGPGCPKALAAGRIAPVAKVVTPIGTSGFIGSTLGSTPIMAIRPTASFIPNQAAAVIAEQTLVSHRTLSVIPENSGRTEPGAEISQGEQAPSATPIIAGNTASEGSLMAALSNDNEIQMLREAIPATQPAYRSAASRIRAVINTTTQRLFPSRKESHALNLNPDSEEPARLRYKHDVEMYGKEYDDDASRTLPIAPPDEKTMSGKEMQEHLRRLAAGYYPGLVSEIENWDKGYPLLLNTKLQKFPEIMEAVSRALKKGTEVIWEKEEDDPYEDFFRSIEDRFDKIPGCIEINVDNASAMITLEFEDYQLAVDAVAAEQIPPAVAGPYNRTFKIRVLAPKNIKQSPGLQPAGLD
jgi:hypothetical protein